MMKWSTTVAVVLGAVALATVAHAEERVSSAEYQEARLRARFRSIGKELQEREVDQEAVSLAAVFERAEETPGPRPGEEGRQRFIFGAQVPRVFCKPMVYCDIELQAGEDVRKIFAGDTERWNIDWSTSGVGEAAVQHVMVKPLYPGKLQTNLVIHTTRRTYHVDLVSPSETPMRFVAFSYPGEDIRRMNEALQSMQALEPSAPDEGSDNALGYEIEAEPWGLHRRYRVTKQGRRRVRKRIDWAPAERDVFDDGKKTFIQLPSEALSRELPILVIRTSAGKDAIVNYRVKGAWLVVDRVFQQAVLVSDVGRQQERVLLERLERK